MDKLWKILLIGSFLVLTAIFFHGLRAEARDPGQVGRYQAAAWAHQTIGFNGIVGYIIIDTTTGDVVSKWSGDLKAFRAEKDESED